MSGPFLVIVLLFVGVLAILTVAALAAVVAIAVRGAVNRPAPGGVDEVGTRQGGGR